MRPGTTLLACLATALVCCSVVPAARGQHCDCEPRIKFLDDLLFRDNCWRDPYEERIETERHDFTQSATTVGRGVAQVESGYTYYYSDQAGEIEQTHATPELLLRMGLSDDIEFRIRWNYTWRFADTGESETGAQDLIWSFKLGVTDQDRWLPKTALQIRGTAPTGGSAWSLQRVEAGFDYIYGWELYEGVDLYGSTGFLPGGLGDFSLLPDEPASDHFYVWSQSVALGLDLTERSTMYAEYFGLFSHALTDNFSIGFFNIGVDYYITNDFVVDFRVGVGLSRDSEDLFSGVGGGYRF